LIPVSDAFFCSDLFWKRLCELKKLEDLFDEDLRLQREMGVGIV
tara:strand:- start:1683 stop:1814 length:132 start_codon:yes stop_codon:yes gene_type:complete